MDYAFSPHLRQIRDLAETIGRDVAAPRAAETDEHARWPRHTFDALATSGLLGLHVDEATGGLGQGLQGLALVCETLGISCASSAMCFGMHSVATAVIAAKPTQSQRDHYLVPIAEGRHITTIALSEAGSGVHFYLPQTRLVEQDDCYVVEGTKHFVTSAGHASSYVISTMVEEEGADGDFSCIVVDGGSPGLSWQEPWSGLGMRGNSSSSLALESVVVPRENLLGERGDQVWYIFEVVAPYFLMAMAGTYLGVAQAALDYATHHMRTRIYAQTGETLANVTVMQHRIAELWMTVEKTRLLIYNAARLGDLGDPSALLAILTAKADAADTAVRVTNEAMTICGGIAYRANDQLARLLRDARASHIMAPPTDVLKTWAGRAMLGLPLL